MMLVKVRLAVHAIMEDNPAGLSPKAIANRMNVSVSLLYSWGDVGEYGRDIPLERLLQLTLVTGDGRALSELCAAAGYAALPIPSLGRISGAEMESIEALHQFSEFMQETSKALMDGVVSEPELRRIEKEGGEAQVAIAKVIETARRQLEAGKVAR